MKLLKVAWILYFILWDSPVLAAAKKVVLDVEDDWAPYSYKAESSSLPRGFSVEVVRLAFKSVNVKVEFNLVPFTRCLQEVLSGANVGCFHVAINDDTQDKYLWPEIPLTKEPLYVFARTPKSQPINSIAGLQKKTVATTAGYAYSKEFDNATGIVKDVGPSDESVFYRIKNQRVQFGVVFDKASRRLFKKNPEFKKTIHKVGQLGATPFYVAFSKSHKEARYFLNKYNEGMSKIMANGQYQKLHKRLESNPDSF